MENRSIPGRKWLGLAVALATCFGIAAIGGWLTGQSVSTWYPTLVKPAWNPPARVFGPVWTTLFFSMAISAWLVWLRAGHRPEGRRALALFGLQLLLNAGWSACFFGWRNPGLAAVEIVILWGAIGVTTLSFWTVQRTAALLLLPYWLWVTFAAVLNFTLWRLN